MTPLHASMQTHRLVDIVVGPQPTTEVRLSSAEPLEATLRAGRWCAVAGGLVLLSVHFFNAFVLDGAVTALDANQDGTPLAWASAVAIWTVAVAALVAATMRTGPLRELLFLACATAFFSLDDMIGVHERLAKMLVLQYGVMDPWDGALFPLVYLPLFAVSAVLILRVARSGTSATFRDAVVGLSLLVAAVALQTLSAPWSADTNLLLTVVGGIEESMKLAGWILIASATLVVMLANVVRRATSSTGIR